jgi:elongation factor P
MYARIAALARAERYPARMAEMVSTNQFKNGMHIDVDGTTYRIVEFQHVKPGKGGAFVRTKLKNFDNGSVVDRTFRAGEKFQRILTSVADMQFLYDDGTDVVMMDTETYEQVTLKRSMCEEDLRWLKEGDTVQLLSVDDNPASLQLPASVELSVTATEPGVKGDTVSNVMKPATLETGAVVQVPLFVNEGDRIRVDTREAKYISRA